ncbi:alpha/beta fold hydrolase [Streptosporangium soli]|nr:alpha/beta fold hydrolase [Streptosporangium sp. KLBMP 9127]
MRTPQNRTVVAARGSSVRPSEPGPHGGWLSCPRASPEATSRLVVIPHAGGAPAVLRPFAELLRPEIETWFAHLPGRESRFAEPAWTSLPDIVAEVCAAITAAIAPPYALFGHSMGGLIAFEVTRELTAWGFPPPVQVIVSACPAPSAAGWPDLREALTDDARLRSWLIELGGVPPGLLASEEMLGLLLPTIRADLQACESYAYRPGPPLPVPLAVYGGRGDRHVPEPALRRWAEHVVGEPAMELFDGGHFYLFDNERAIASRLRSTLSAHLLEGGDR